MLRLHRASRADALADGLAQLLREPLTDPFAAEVVAVPAKGVERWLSQALSATLGVSPGGADGVAANVLFPSPTRLVDDAVAAASGVLPDADPWTANRVLWELLRTIDDCMGEPWCGTLASYLGAGEANPARAGRRYATAAHLAGLYRSYAAHRPQLLVDWAAGDDTDGAGVPLEGDQRWQAELWRQLRARLDAPSPSERLASTCARLRDEPATSALPARLSLFGATRLSTEQRQVLSALAVHREVHLWLPHPSPTMWTSLAGRLPQLRRRADTSVLLVQNPLLRSLSRDIRELQQLLEPAADEHLDEAPTPDTLLRRLQAAIRDDSPSQSVESVTPDGTVQVHACHGPPRQVEVLREALLHLLQADPALEPRDVLVLCPDVETYAPLVRAAFGPAGGAHPGARLPLRLADRSPQQTNPVLAVLADLIALADGRVRASELLDLAAALPVRRRFGFSEEELSRLRDWAVETGVRWGLGEQQRAAFRLSGVPQGTWDTGLDRLLLGVAADETELAWLDRALPLDDVDSSDVDLAGRLADLVERLETVLSTLQSSQPAMAWATALSNALDTLVEVASADSWQLEQARTELGDAFQHSGETVLRLADIRGLLANRLAGRPTRVGFRTGELTVCTLVPMRSVPHRVVAVLGLDDGVFPRAGSTDGDDVLARSPCLGERDARSEDRQLLLDAMMSAGDHLLLLYTGADDITGAARPPAVPLGEVLDALRDTTGDRALTGVLTQHPLQPFDPRDFVPPAPFSFDLPALAGARALVSDREPAPPLLDAPLPPRRDDLDVTELIGMLVHPIRAFFTRRLRLGMPFGNDAISDVLPADLDPLQRWDVGDRMLAARVDGVELAAFRQAEWRRGTLPPGPLGLRLLAELEASVEPLVAAGAAVRTVRARVIDVSVDLDDGRRVTGTVGSLYGDVLSSTSYSRLGPKHRLAAWVRLLLLAAAGIGATAVTTGRGPSRQPVWQSTLVPPDDPTGALRDLVGIYDEGWCEPLPMATSASCAYAETRARGELANEALRAAAAAFGDRFGDASDTWVSYAHGREPPFELLTAVSADGAEPTRFGALACRLWAPLLAVETLGRP